MKGERPSNVAVVLLDSLNRHMLGSYGATEFETPNLDRFAKQRATRFTRHVTGSLPCMPARHDILCDALDFLWKPWGSIEAWEEPITRVLQSAGVTSCLATDHPHLFETGGENYHCDFSGWNYLRGGEGDPWRTYADPSWLGAPAMPARGHRWFWEKQGFPVSPPRGSDLSRTFFREEADYPGPRTMLDAARFLREATPHHDRWFLFVDEFDPHEPFDTPAPWAGRYFDEPWDEDWLIWPPYTADARGAGVLSDREARHLRANYGAKLSMIDHWFGRILERFDDQGLWDDTVLIVCTDHGHYLGEVRQGGDIWGKPAVPQYEPLGHTPLLIAWPGGEGGTVCDALTTNVDLFATVSDIFDAPVKHRTHGRSLVPLLTGEAQSVREWAIGGIWGNWVQITDGDRKYARGAVGANAPLSMWSNRWSTMPLHIKGLEAMAPPDRRAWLATMPGSEVPVIRQPYAEGDRLPFWAGRNASVDDHHLYDLRVDPNEAENRAGKAGEVVESEMIELLVSALVELEAPDDQRERLGLA